MTPWRTITVALHAATAGYTRGLANAGAATQAFGRQAETGLARADRAAERSNAAASRASAGWISFRGAAATGLAGLAIAAGASIREAINWETAWAGVQKTVDGTETEMAVLEDRLIGMSKRLPATREEIAGVAEAAGQLGIAQPVIADFTEHMIALGVSTNLSADEAATGLARFMNVMGTDVADIERLGATLVDLGNKGASTEREILDMAQRLSGIGNLVGASEADVLALANAMSSVGIEAELGGGAVQRVMLKIVEAAAEGTVGVAEFAEAANMSGEDFLRSWAEAPMDTFRQVVDGLADVHAEGGNVVEILGEMGIKGTQERQVMLRLVGASDTLAQSLSDGRTAWDEGSALAVEASKRYETAASRIRIFANRVSDAARVAGAQLVPILLGALDAAERFGAWLQRTGVSAAERLEGAWESLQSAGSDLVDILGTIWETVDPLATAFAQLGGAAVIGAISGIATALESITGALADNEGLVRAVTLAFVAYLGAQVPAVLGAVTWGIGNMIAAWGTFQAAITGSAIVTGLQGIATGFTTMSTSITLGAAQVNAAVASMTAGISGVALGFGAAAAGAGLLFMGINRAHGKAKKQIEDLKPTGFDARSVGDLLGYQQSIQDLAEEAAHAKDATTGFFQNLKGAAELMTPMENAVLDNAIAAGDYQAAFEAASEATKRLMADQQAIADSTGLSRPQVEKWILALDIPPEMLGKHGQVSDLITKAKVAADHGTPATEGLADAYATLADETSTATERIDAWKTSIDKAFGFKQSVYDATTGYARGIRDLTEALTENGAVFDESTEKGEANRSALSSMVDLAKDRAVAIAEESGSIEDATNALTVFREQIIQTMVARGMSRAGAEEELTRLGFTKEAFVLLATDAATAQTKVDEVAEALGRIPDGKRIDLTVHTWWDSASSRLAEILATSGGGLSTGQVFAGRWGRVDHYAQGGVRPAMIGSGKNMIWWDEPETGGEAYVPRLGNPAKSIPIIQTIADWYDMTAVPKGWTGFSAGGITGATAPPRGVQPIIAPVRIDSAAIGREVAKALSGTTGNTTNWGGVHNSFDMRGHGISRAEVDEALMEAAGY